MTKNVKLKGLTQAALGVAIAFAAAVPGHAKDVRLTINGGQTNGAFNQVASGLAAYSTKNIDGVKGRLC